MLNSIQIAPTSTNYMKLMSFNLKLSQVIYAKYPACHRATSDSFIDRFIVSSEIADIGSDRAKNIVKLSDDTGISIETSIKFGDGLASSNNATKLFDQADFGSINEELGRKLDELCIPNTTNMQH